MLENTVRWRRDYHPDELDPDYIKPEVYKRERRLCVVAPLGNNYFMGFTHNFSEKSFFILFFFIFTNNS